MTESAANSPGQKLGPEFKDKRFDEKDVLKQPMPGPEPVGPEWFLDPDPKKPLSVIGIAGRFFADTVRIPARWIRENIVLPNRGPKYYYYHKRFRRALPIDECYMDDLACIYEANIEYKRIHRVDEAVLELLRYRRDACHYWYTTQHAKHYTAPECEELAKTYDREETNFHTKYGNMPYNSTVLHAYNKQKCRMIVDRRRAIRLEKEENEQKQASTE